MEEFCDPSSSKGYDEFSLYMDMLKREHPDLFRMILSALYPVFYLENSIKLLEVETIEDENIEEEAELYVISREALLDVTTLDDVVNGNYSERDIQALNTAERYATTMGLSQVDEEHLDNVRGFVTKMGAEFGAVFDALWTHGDENRLERIAEAQLATAQMGGVRR